MTFEEGRALFPVLERLAYLNTGSNGPLASPVVEAMRQEEERALHEGRGDQATFKRTLAQREVVAPASRSSSASSPRWCR